MNEIKSNNTANDNKVEKQTILAVDDEESIIDLLKFNIEKEGYNFISANNGEDGLKMVMEKSPDLIICREIRQEKINTPIIMLSARGEEIDKILGLEIGSDDYMTKPFSPRELLARIKANLRKTEKSSKERKNNNPNLLVVGNLKLDLEQFEVFVKGKKVDDLEVFVKGKKVDDLTRREFEVLRFLAQNPNQVVSREDLLEKVWGYEYYGDIRTVKSNQMQLILKC